MTTVLHVLHTWGHPSETFVRSLVTTTPGVRPVVVAEEVIGAGTPAGLVHSLSGLRRRLRGPIGAKAAVLVTAAIGRRARADIVHAHFAHELPLADRAARLLRRPLVVSLHGRDLLVEADRQPATLAVIRRAQAVVVPSPFLAGAAVDRGVAADRIAVIPSGIDPDEIPFRAGPPPHGHSPLVVFIGRFVAKKGVLDAAAAIQAVAETHALRARFVGFGELQPDLEAALVPLGDRAEVVDGSERAVALRALAEADILLSPSRTAPDGDAETLLLVNAEAQAAGVPVLTTDHGGIPSGLGPGAAVTVPEGDADALAAALAELLDHPERWPEMGRAGRRHVEAQLTNRRTGARTAELYTALVHGLPVPGELHPQGSRL